jgi:ankyrin repeat protein
VKGQNFRGKRTALITVWLLALCVASAGLWLRARQRQYALNRQLIATLVKGDNKQALALVNAGADPNTHYTPTPVPSLLQLARQLLHRSPTPVNDSETALSIACGGYWDGMSYGMQELRPDDAHLVQVMLTLGATVNVADDRGDTPLMWAAISHRLNSVRLLLDHRANVNAKTKHGYSSLEYAALFGRNSDLVRLLLEQGANANMQDENGETALDMAVCVHADKDVIRQLLAHGANPNLADNRGVTPLRWEKGNNRPDLVALLIQYGARK